MNVITKNKILITSPSKFENRTLAHIINEKTKFPCIYCSDNEIIDLLKSHLDKNISSTVLILWDYQNNNEETLRKVYRFCVENNEKTRFLLALYNILNHTKIGNDVLELNMRGLFYEDINVEKFIKGINSILKGNLWFPRNILENYFRRRSSRSVIYSQNFSLPVLTPREKEILQGIAAGKTNIEISESLFVSKSTVKTHIYNIFQKINATNRIQAVLWALKYLPEAQLESMGHLSLAKVEGSDLTIEK